MKKTNKIADEQKRTPYVPTKYLESTDEGAFEGMTVKAMPSGKTAICPVCQGHGGWHLRLNASGKHFDCFCNQCNGYGWVKKDSPDATCVHETRELSQKECQDLNIIHFGSCWHVEQCKHCGKISSYDSSD